MAAPDDECFASLERNFIGIGCAMEAQTTVSNSTQCGLFAGKYKKYTVSGVTSSFKKNAIFCPRRFFRRFEPSDVNVSCNRIFFKAFPSRSPLLKGEF